VTVPGPVQTVTVPGPVQTVQVPGPVQTVVQQPQVQVVAQPQYQYVQVPQTTYQTVAVPYGSQIPAGGTVVGQGTSTTVPATTTTVRQSE
jgi:hypothetical protein